MEGPDQNNKAPVAAKEMISALKQVSEALEILEKIVERLDSLEASVEELRRNQSFTPTDSPQPYQDNTWNIPYQTWTTTTSEMGEDTVYTTANVDNSSLSLNDGVLIRADSDGNTVEIIGELRDIRLELNTLSGRIANSFDSEGYNKDFDEILDPNS